ncbi:MAG: IclR family transcriptional regulator [Rhodospirillales bacterium]
MRKRSGKSEAGSSSTALVRGLQILRAFTPDDTTLGNQDLIERTGLPKATVSRLTATLVDLGYLHYDRSLGRYSVGPATVSLGYSALSSNAVVHMARPLMQEMAEATGAAVALGTRDGNEMVYLANCRSHSPVSLQLNVGSRLPIWRTAMGLAYLVEMSEPARERLLRAEIAAAPDREASYRALIEEALACQAEQGFICSFGRWYSYINAVGVAFRPTDGSPVVALTCGAIVDLLTPERCRDDVGPRFLELKAELAERLAGRAGAVASEEGLDSSSSLPRK